MVIYTGQGTGTRAAKIKKDGDNFVTEELWTNSEVGTNFNTPVLKDGMLYGISTDSKFYCMSAENGKTTWIGSEGIDRFGSIIDAGSCLLALSPKSELIVIEPNVMEYKELARYKVSDNPVYACPIVTGNHIYIKDQVDSITLWTVE
jgi:outer membrane protein assembly factor BamB